jgi:hypothetical protein
MAKANNPVTVSGHFGVDPKKLQKIGVLDATLAIDTKLFIDPLLLAKSTHAEINRDAVAQYKNHFEQIIMLLRAVTEEDDPAWKAAYRLFDFPEVPGTCLGYGAATIRGSGWGPELRKKTLRVASKVVEIGVKEPDLFPALGLFEDDIGPDRLSDMTANIAIEALEKFNARVLKVLNLKGEVFLVGGKKCTFLRHPFETSKKTPLILVPTDVLRDLPVALDWGGVQEAALANQDLRVEVSKHVSEIWKAKTKKDKAGLKKQAMESETAFMTMLSAMRAAGKAPYDVANDPDNLVRWANLGREYAEANPVAKKPKAPKNVDDVHHIVREIVLQFRHLIEDSGLNRELYNAKKQPRHESSAQRLFFAAAYAYCKAFDVDVSPEIDTGNGKVDFKFSQGFEARVLVEIKLSTNQATVPGYTKQLDVYKKAQQTTRAIYLVVDVGKMGDKEKDLIAIKNRLSKQKMPVSDLEFVDGTLKPTASKRK